MSAFVNSIQLGKEFKNYTTVLEFTTGTYEEEGESVLQKKVPVRFEVYETDVSNRDPVQRTLAMQGSII